jgi:hypothetical protein
MVVFVTLQVNFIPETTHWIYVEFGNVGLQGNWSGDLDLGSY